jgi:hypothetical protein
MKKYFFLTLSLVLALPLMAGCGQNAPETSGVLTPTTATQISNQPQQTRVVLAEMFTGDW